MSSEDVLQNAVEGLESVHYRRSLGVLLRAVAEANADTATGLSQMAEGLRRASEESGRLNKRILWLTLVVALSAIVQALYYGGLMFGAVY